MGRIPERYTFTFCSECKARILTGGLCTFGCKWDAWDGPYEEGQARPVESHTYVLDPEHHP